MTSGGTPLRAGPGGPPALFCITTGGGAPVPRPGPEPAPGPTPTPGGLRRFDQNGNCLIDDPEFFDAVEQWVNGQVDNSTFFDLIDAWIQKTNVCTSGSALPASVALKVGRTGVTFETGGPNAAALSVRIYDLVGRTIWAGQAFGSRLIWRYRTREGLPIANGVYLYEVIVRGLNGEILQREIRKLGIAR